jgi:hypothetical protein
LLLGDERRSQASLGNALTRSHVERPSCAPPHGPVLSIAGTSRVLMLTQQTS